MKSRHEQMIEAVGRSALRHPGFGLEQREGFAITPDVYRGGSNAYWPYEPYEPTPPLRFPTAALPTTALNWLNAEVAATCAKGRTL